MTPDDPRPPHVAAALDLGHLGEQVTELSTLWGWRHLAARRSVGNGKVIGAGPGFPTLLLWRPGQVVAAWLVDDDADLDAMSAATADSMAEAGMECHTWSPDNWGGIEGVLRPRIKYNASREDYMNSIAQAKLDQAEAADRNARALFDAQEQEGPMSYSDAGPVAELILRAVSRGGARCQHLVDRPGQTMAVRLDVGLVTCQPCAAIAVPPPADLDRCAWCGQLDALDLVTMAAQVGAVLAIGRACPSCAAALEGRNDA